MLQRNSLVCVSCIPHGVPESSASLSFAPPSTNVDQRFQGDDGSTIVFHTSSRLVPQDQTSTALDTYMWRDGRVWLVSGGKGQRDSIVVGTTAAGNEVFFTSADRLTADALQDNIKLYVARLNGGFSPPEEKPLCEGEACQRREPQP